MLRENWPAINGALTVVVGISVAAVYPLDPSDGDLGPQLAAAVGGAALGIAATATARTVGWCLAGGKPSLVQFGFGALRRTWTTRRGAMVGITMLPLALNVYGAARNRRIARLPWLVALLIAVGIAAWALVTLHGTPSPGVWGAAMAALLTALATIVPRVPPGAWFWLARGEDLEAHFADERLLRTIRRLDVAGMLAATEPLPTDPSILMVTARALALSRERRYAEAIALLEAHAWFDERYHPTLVHQLATVHHQAMEAGDPAGAGAVTRLPELARLVTWHGGMAIEEHDLNSLLALVRGDYEQAEQQASWLVTRMPRGLRAHSLCTIARAQAGTQRYAEAHATLARARTDDPLEPRLAAAERAITAAEEGGDLTAASR